MTIRSRRRAKEGVTLDDMSDDELQEIRFFANVASNNAITYRATEAEQKRAYEILRERGAIR